MCNLKRRKGMIIGLLVLDLAAVAFAGSQILTKKEQRSDGINRSGKNWYNSSSSGSMGPVPGSLAIPIGIDAEDFTLPNVVDGQPVTLSSLHAEKPVVLLLSSFT